MEGNDNSQRAHAVTNPPFDSPDPADDPPFDNAAQASDVPTDGDDSPPVRIDAPWPETPENSPPKLGLPILGWTLIVIMLAIILGRGLILKPQQEAFSEAFEGLAVKQLEIQGKLMLGIGESQSELFKTAAAAGEISEDDKKTMEKAAESNLEAIKKNEGGSLGIRIRTAILIGEFGDAKDALERLNSTQELVDDETVAGLFNPTPRDKKLLRLTNQLYQDYQKSQFDSHSLSKADEAYLEKELGWFGMLALHPETDSPDATRKAMRQESIMMVVVLFAFMFLFLALFGIGFFTCITYALFLGLFSILKPAKWLRTGMTGPHLNGGLYAETFGIWLALYFGGGVSLMFIGIPEGWGMIAQLVIFFGSLIVIGWPVLRGVPFSEVRREIGWTFNTPWEPLFGLLNYAATLPLLLIGGMFSIIVAGVISAFTPEATEAASQLVNAQGPTHPIAFEIGESGWGLRIQLILLACVAAPIVEETMFRGVLYRHLRDASVGWRIGTSVMFSALLNAFIFAIVHPQGPIAVPVLMSLAVGFSLSREWRGSLVAPMVSHAVHNGLIMSFALYILS